MAVPVAGRVTGEGANDTLEFVVRSATGGVVGGTAGAGVGVCGVVWAGAGAGAFGPAAAARAAASAPEWAPSPRLAGDLSRGIVSEPVLRPRIFTSWMFGIRRIWGFSMMIISVWSRLLRSYAKKYLSIGIFFRPGRPLSDVASVSVIRPPKILVSPSTSRISCCT